MLQYYTSMMTTGYYVTSGMSVYHNKVTTDTKIHFSRIVYNDLWSEKNCFRDLDKTFKNYSSKDWTHWFSKRSSRHLYSLIIVSKQMILLPKLEDAGSPDKQYLASENLFSRTTREGDQSCYGICNECAANTMLM